MLTPVRSHSDQALPTVSAAALGEGDGTPMHWRIEQIWGDGVGILGGPPKCAKSWFGLDMAVSLASGTPLLGHFPVHDPGPTLVYLAEDDLQQVRARIVGLCKHRRIDIESLKLHVITVPVLRLDQPQDQRRLKLLLLDPLVRLHRLDENDSGAISGLLGFLREIQRRFDVAIVLVHHMRKAIRAQLGQALRGSGDLHAWSDFAAYLTRVGHNGERLRLTLEHRSAPAIEPFDLRLVSDNDGSATHLEVTSRSTGPAADDESHAGPQGDQLHQRILVVLAREGRPLSRAQLRTSLRINNNRLGEALLELERSGRLRRENGEWRLTQ